MLLEQGYRCNSATIPVRCHLNRATDATMQQYQYGVTWTGLQMQQCNDISMVSLEQSYRCNKAMISLWCHFNRAKDATMQRYQYGVTWTELQMQWWNDISRVLLEESYRCNGAMISVWCKPYWKPLNWKKCTVVLSYTDISIPFLRLHSERPLIGSCNCCSIPFLRLYSERPLIASCNCCPIVGMFMDW
jgi:hypothetical protein